MLDILRRYFVGNTAPIISIERTGFAFSYVPCNTGNSGGFYWGNWRITWRKPYSTVWAWDGRRWVHAYTLKEVTTPCAGSW